ncbi:hypothetical protein BDF20DRAFT_849435 [Mycotypha africana]|uniref:uncharacterized protein n=1 Tax=Mycotypha africana TaxID=64632 RepID=UPI002301DC81|nr:uncharacterized protein BDF20DRAFT_849435 [Mycotypha africana]KAI8987322.1 hypothetical protein BDF20DRAFT_849435 [Mycotypha africana]
MFSVLLTRKLRILHYHCFMRFIYLCALYDFGNKQKIFEKTLMTHFETFFFF